MIDEVMLVTKRRGLIQAFRAMQAVAELGITIVVPPEEKSRWEFASTWFDLPFRAEQGSGAPIVEIGLDHTAPRVTLGDVERSLVFPNIVFDAYRQSWGDRQTRLSFEGNKTRRRRRALSVWERRQRMKLGLGSQEASPGMFGAWSDGGREWPRKAWDPEYVNRLGSSQFALCPDGDFVWTYRFFEAAAAGAIPIVENVSPIYAGFRFYRMTDRLDDLEWTEEAASHNHEQARRLLTIPHEILRAELERLVRQ